MITGLIFDVQGYSVHDGSGCRTLVFLSGCPLRCRWCSNPEGQMLKPRLMYRVAKCIHTHYRCVSACPNNAIRITNDKIVPIQFNRSICDQCDSMDCVSACLNETLRISGRSYTVEQLMRILVRDQGFWGTSGGVTFGGGEPLFQAEFLIAVLEKCRANYMHTVVETCAYADANVFKEVLKLTDAIFIDLKHTDSEAHRVGTGVGNEVIFRNIETAVAMKWDGRLIIRVPIVPGFNDTIENLQETAAFMKRLKLKEVNLLPFHRLGNSKYEQLGIIYEYSQVSTDQDEALRSYQRVFESAGLRCYIGSDTPF